MQQRKLKYMGLFVVMATHPQNPNHSHNSRGRVQHLSVSEKQETLTLCNMMVSFPVIDWGHSSFNRPCQVCVSKVVTAKLKNRPEPLTYKQAEIPAMSYSFTINTDASHDPHTKTAAWATWIKSSHYLIKEAGLFPEPVINSSVAEAMAIEQALMLLDNLIDSEEFLRDHRARGKIVLYINTDSMWTINALKGLVKRSKHVAVARRVRSLAEPFTIIPRHVKGHSAGEDSQSWVNNWCDKQAYGLVRKKLEELNGPKKS